MHRKHEVRVENDESGGSGGDKAAAAPMQADLVLSGAVCATAISTSRGSGDRQPHDIHGAAIERSGRMKAAR